MKVVTYMVSIPQLIDPTALSEERLSVVAPFNFSSSKFLRFNLFSLPSPSPKSKISPRCLAQPLAYFGSNNFSIPIISDLQLMIIGFTGCNRSALYKIDSNLSWDMKVNAGLLRSSKASGSVVAKSVQNFGKASFNFSQVVIDDVVKLKMTPQDGLQ